MRSNCKPLTLESLIAMRSVLTMLQNLSAHYRCRFIYWHNWQ